MRLRIDLAYDGTGFHGWACQNGLRTVQGELEAALDTALRTSGSRLTVAGRTDTGVHARGQVAHLDIDEPVLESMRGREERSATEALVRRLNGILAPDVRIRQVEQAPPGFDARFSASWRRYAYRVADRPETVDPLLRAQVLSWPRALDEVAMNQAAVSLLGLREFAAFCKRREGATTVRTLLQLTWTRDANGVLTACVRADAFCHHLVRSLVGALIAVGDGRRTTAWPAQVLTAAVRDSAVVVVPAHGLCLEEVGYPEESALATRARDARAVRSLG